jgi:hypothetical protein
MAENKKKKSETFNGYSNGYASAYGTEHMIDLIPTMFSKAYTVPPKEAYLDMAENAVSYDTAIRNWQDEMAQFYPENVMEEDIFMTGDEVEATDSDALDKAIYQVSLEERGGTDSLMTPHGLILEPNELDAMRTKYTGLISDLDPDTYEEDIEMADELLRVAGDEIDTLVESVQHRAEKEGMMEDVDVFLRMAGDQINDAITSSGIVDITTRTIEDIGETVGEVATNIASMFDEGMEAASTFIDQAFPTDDIIPGEGYQDYDPSLADTTLTMPPGVDINEFAPTQAGIGMPGFGIAGQAIGDLGREIGGGIASGYEDVTGLMGKEPGESIEDWYERTMVTGEGTPLMGANVMEKSKWAVPGGISPIEAMEERKAGEADLEENIAALNKLLDPPYFSIQELMEEIKSGISDDTFEKDHLMAWVRQGRWNDMVRRSNIDPSILYGEIEFAVRDWGKKSYWERVVTDPWRIGGIYHKFGSMTKDEEMQKKAVEGKPYTYEKVKALQQEGYTWDGAVYVLENELDKRKILPMLGETGQRMPDYSRSAIIKEKLLEGYTVSEAEQFYDNLDVNLKIFAVDPQRLEELARRGQLPTEKQDIEEFRGHLKTLVEKEAEVRIHAPETEYKRWTEARSQIGEPTKITKEGVKEKLVIEPSELKVPLRRSVQEYLGEANKSMSSVFYNKAYSIPGMGKYEYTKHLPDIYSRSLVVFYLTHGNQFLEGMAKAGMEATAEGASLEVNNMISLYEGFVNNYFKNYEAYHQPEYLTPYIKLVGNVLRKLESDPSLRPSSKDGTWEQDELDALPWIQEYFVDGTYADTNRKWLVSLSLNRGKAGRGERQLKKRLSAIMDHWGRLGWTKSEVFDQMLKSYIGEKPDTVAPLSVVGDVEVERQDPKDEMAQFYPMVEEGDDLVGEVDIASALTEMHPGVVPQGLEGSGRQDYYPSIGSVER